MANKKFVKKFALLLFLLTMRVFASETHLDLSFGDEDGVVVKDKVTATDVAQLKNLDNSIRELKKQLKELERKYQENSLKSPQDEERIQILRSKVEGLRNDFVAMSAGIDWNTFQGNSTIEKRDLMKEFHELIAPFLDTIRRMSERPRRIERMRKDLKNAKLKILTLESGQLRLQQLKKMAKGQEILQSMDEAEKLLTTKANDFAIEKGILESKLEMELKQQGSIISEVTELSKTLLLTKGKNLFLAILVFIFIWTPMVFLQRRFIAQYLEKKSSHAKANWQLILSWGGGAMAFGGSMLTLYWLNDWVLFTAFTLVILSILWSTRQLLPRFFQEFRLIFNMGTVREGEVLSLDGVLYRVEKLSFFSILRNEHLDGGLVRIMAKDLVGLHSRPMSHKCPIFPTDAGDYIRVNGVAIGKVKIQTPEVVIVERWGGALQSYSTQSFIQLNVDNISKGFVVFVNLELDYSHQKDIEEITRVLTRDVEALFKNVKKVLVEFQRSGEYGLIFLVALTCDGHLAVEYNSLMRRLEKACLNICNQEKYLIAGRLLVLKKD